MYLVVEVEFDGRDAPTMSDHGVWSSLEGARECIYTQVHEIWMDEGFPVGADAAANEVEYRNAIAHQVWALQPGETINLQDMGPIFGIIETGD